MDVHLRRLVLEHKATERRLRFAPVLHVGAPGRPELWRSEQEGTLDHGLRCDVLEGVLGKAARSGADEGALAWLTRSGDLEVQDVDLAWLRAVTAVNAETDRDLLFVVVTRHGWHDPRTGTTRTWRRLRQR